MWILYTGSDLLGGGDAARAAPGPSGAAERRRDSRAYGRQHMPVRRVSQYCRGYPGRRQGGQPDGGQCTMRPFGYSRPTDVAGAIAEEHRRPEARYLGGGTNLIDLMKMGVEQPAHLVDITRLPLDRIEDRSGGIRIGAMVRNSELAADELVRKRYPV